MDIHDEFLYKVQQAISSIPESKRGTIGYLLRDRKIIHTVIQFKTFAPPFLASRYNDKCVIVPLAKDRSNISRNCILCYDV